MTDTKTTRCAYYSGCGFSVMPANSVAYTYQCCNCRGRGFVCNLCHRNEEECECPSEPLKVRKKEPRK